MVSKDSIAERAGLRCIYSTNPRPRYQYFCPDVSSCEYYQREPGSDDGKA